MFPILNNLKNKLHVCAQTQTKTPDLHLTYFPKVNAHAHAVTGQSEAKKILTEPLPPKH